MNLAQVRRSEKLYNLSESVRIYQNLLNYLIIQRNIELFGEISSFYKNKKDAERHSDQFPGSIASRSLF